MVVIAWNGDPGLGNLSDPSLGLFKLLWHRGGGEIAAQKDEIYLEVAQKGGDRL